jgi:hypothetical protein
LDKEDGGIWDTIENIERDIIRFIVFFPLLVLTTFGLFLSKANIFLCRFLVSIWNKEGD